VGKKKTRKNGGRQNVHAARNRPKPTSFAPRAMSSAAGQSVSGSGEDAAAQPIPAQPYASFLDLDLDRDLHVGRDLHRSAPAPLQAAAPPALSGRPPVRAAHLSRHTPTDSPREMPEPPAASDSHSPSWSEAIGEVDPGVAATYWTDSADHHTNGDLHIRFTGVRTDAATPLGEQDRFDRVTRVGPLPKTSGRVSVTARVRGVNPGTWRIDAAPFDPARSTSTGDAQIIETRTRLWPLAYGPGVRVWSWPILVALGAVLALVMQAVLLTRTGGEPAGILGVSLLACALGVVGAKGWYLLLHRQPLRQFARAGACIQGFLVVALAVLALGGYALGLQVGTLLDVTTPGLFLGMAVGRPGCFLTGCCAGRPTASRWGLWSSNRMIGIRRLPVQLLEAVAALAIGVVTLVLVVTMDAGAGAVFVGAVAAYTLVRQLLFPLRADPHTRRGRHVTIALCLALLVAVVVWAVWSA